MFIGDIDRDEWARIFGRSAAAERNGYDGKSVAHLFTHDEVRRAGLASEASTYAHRSDKHPHHTNGYYYRSTFTRDVVGWDAVRGHGVDMMHQLPNFGRTLIHIMGNIYSGLYTWVMHVDEMKRRGREHHVVNWRPEEVEPDNMNLAGDDEPIGEHMHNDRADRHKQPIDDDGKEEKKDIGFGEVEAPVMMSQFEADGGYEPIATPLAQPAKGMKRQPWQLTKTDQQQFDERCEQLRLPFRDTHMPALFNREHAADFRIKSAHWLIFLGPVGIWLLLGCQSLAPEIMDLICDAIWWCHQITAKDFQRDELAWIEESGHQIFTRLELRLPLKCATLARHYLSHACWFIRCFGPLHTHWQ
jgi:hypothetical protein